MARTDTEFLQGTLDLLILKTLALEPLHGYGVLLRIQQVSQDALRVQQGSLLSGALPAGQKGLIAGE